MRYHDIFVFAGMVGILACGWLLFVKAGYLIPGIALGLIAIGSIIFGASYL